PPRSTPTSPPRAPGCAGCSSSTWTRCSWATGRRSSAAAPRRCGARSVEGPSDPRRLESGERRQVECGSPMSDPTHPVPRASRLRRRAALLVGALACGAVLVLAGPRPHVDTTLRPLALPGELGALEPWLAEREAGVADVRSGCAARVVWADARARARTPVALVYLH